MSELNYEGSLDWAKKMDEADPLKKFREQFYFPVDGNQNAKLYFCGNSLGLQPKTANSYLQQELEDWQKFGVEGHFQAKNPWFHYHKFLSDQLGKLVGGNAHEVIAMNSLTVNLHLLMVSFYRPTSTKYKILIENAAFPSDHYAVESQVRHHGLKPGEAIVELNPREGEHGLRDEDVIEAIHQQGDSLALVLLPGVQYYTGHYFDLPGITKAAHQVDAYAGFDLAHAIGNVPMNLHDADVDFAVWCSYKYLNSGPGGVGGAFINEKYADQKDLQRFAGWWGHKEENRFMMEKGFDPEYGIDGWQLSNAPVFPMALLKASLDIFEKAGIDVLRTKSKQLTGYLEFLIHQLQSERGNESIEIITPEDPERRGAQLSILVHKNGRTLYEQLVKNNVVIDWREPNVIRVAPAPLYNTFEEVFHFGEILKEHVT